MLFNEKSLSNVSLVKKKIKSLNLNFGPQHPAAHGVLRLQLQLDNETVDNVDVHIGLLHRGTEKLIEGKLYTLSLPYFDRLDYVSMMVQEHAYCLAVEKLKASTNFTQRGSQIRTIYDELTRILNHLLAIGCHALDVGSMSPLFWAFEEREKIMEFYENISGARMHAAYYRPGVVRNSIGSSLVTKILNFVLNFYKLTNEVSNVLTENNIWKRRLVNVGAYSSKEVTSWGLSGVMARCTGVKKDIRVHKNTTYGNYYSMGMKSFVTRNGDSYDRFLLRMQEMVESANIVTMSISKISKNDLDRIRNKFLLHRNMWLAKDNGNTTYTTMEDLIKHFKFWSEGYTVDKGFTSQYVESPKGEFGVSLFADSSNIPYRCKIKSGAYNHIQFLPKLIKGKLLADLITSIGTIDIVFGEIDR